MQCCRRENSRIGNINTLLIIDHSYSDYSASSLLEIIGTLVQIPATLLHLLKDSNGSSTSNNEMQGGKFEPKNTD